MRDTGIFSTEIWQAVMFTIAGCYAIYLMFKNQRQLLKGSRWQVYGLTISVVAWWYIGTRPIWCYTDTALYTTMFNLVKHGNWQSIPIAEGEWFWKWVQDLCLKLTDASGWLMVVAAFYVGGMCFAAWRWMRNNYTIAVMYLLTAFSFWGYATNGIRQGMASSLIMAGLTLVTPKVHKNWLKLLPVAALCVFGCGTHNSMWLVVAAAALPLFSRRDGMPSSFGVSVFYSLHSPPISLYNLAVRLSMIAD